MKTAFLITCEHASAHVPERFSILFSNQRAQAELSTHRASDIGALAVARKLARSLGAPLFSGTMTRLLIDLNRSPYHEHLFSEWSRKANLSDRSFLLARYTAYRRAVIDHVRGSRDRVCHLSIHSFSPVFSGKTRSTDIGLLYDPSHTRESAWASKMKTALVVDPSLCVHRNAPYRGTSDGFTKALRAQFSQNRYMGLEIEINQRLLGSASERNSMAGRLITALGRM